MQSHNPCQSIHPTDTTFFHFVKERTTVTGKKPEANKPRAARARLLLIFE